MNFDLSADQKMLADTASAFVKRQSPIGRARAMREDAVGYEPAIWKQMGDLGWLALLVPEDQGGVGRRFADAAILLEQFGTALVPEPYIASVILAGTALARAGDPAQREKWLTPMIAGDATLAFAYAEKTSRFDPARVETRATRDGDRYVVRGDKTFVLGGHAADAFLVTARTSGAAADADPAHRTPTATATATSPIQPEELITPHFLLRPLGALETPSGARRAGVLRRANRWQSADRLVVRREAAASRSYPRARPASLHW